MSNLGFHMQSSLGNSFVPSRVSISNPYGFSSFTEYRHTERAGVIRREVYGNGYAIWVLVSVMRDTSGYRNGETPIWLCVYSTDLSKIGSFRGSLDIEMARFPIVGYIPDSPADLASRKGEDKWLT